MKEHFVEQFFVAASETFEFKHMYQISKRDSHSLVFEKVLKQVNRERYQTFLLNIIDKYCSD